MYKGSIKTIVDLIQLKEVGLPKVILEIEDAVREIEDDMIGADEEDLVFLNVLLEDMKDLRTEMLEHLTILDD